MSRCVHDNDSYTRLEFHSTVSYRVDAHSNAIHELEVETESADEADLDAERQDSQTQQPTVAQSDAQADTAKSVLSSIRTHERLAFVACSHHRFLSVRRVLMKSNNKIAGVPFVEPRLTRSYIFTAPHYASAVYAVVMGLSVRLSVHPSQTDVKRLNAGSRRTANGQNERQAQA